jgi:hypothetical protein
MLDELSQLKDWVPVLAPLATLTVGLIAGFIAFQQWRVARNKLKLDLFDRRYKAYAAVKNFLTERLYGKTFSDDELIAYYASTADAAFLFPEEIYKFTYEVSTHAVAFRASVIGIKATESMQQEQYKEVFNRELRWLVDQMPVLVSKFAPYLSFHRPPFHRRVWRFFKMKIRNNIGGSVSGVQ